MKSDPKTQAIILRRRGLTYSEILAQIPVAKSTLSSWLHSVALAKQTHRRLTKKKILAQQRGAIARHQQRLTLMDQIKNEAFQEMRELNNDHLWLAGIMLYWAEGSKAKEHLVSQQVNFNNSDPKMIKVFLGWLLTIIKIPKNEIAFALYIHNTADIEKALSFWAKTVSCDKRKIKVYFKEHKLKTGRKNTGIAYNGLLRIIVRKSTNLNRKISAWVDHICNYWGVVQW
ncbi:MAG: hypothetical protein G01um10143_432 [Parcubacteria group bacterium Gr01-1014_3]|nr:MAG: hypothetical protein G01um10143_432 [Parcubacteria group bacterium Gr01-1014_3]